MPNIATALKNEIARLARKEVRLETEALRRAVVAYRSEIAALKRRADGLERSLKSVRRGAAPAVAAPVASDALESKARFSAKGFASQRRRLGLSAAEVGLLLNASGQSIYNWETGAARPRASYLPAIVAMRKLGRKDAAAIVASIRSGS